MLERLIRLLLGIFVRRVPVLDRCLTAMQGMITCVHRELPALLTRGITQSGTIARVLSVLVPVGGNLLVQCFPFSYMCRSRIAALSSPTCASPSAWIARYQGYSTYDLAQPPPCLCAPFRTPLSQVQNMLPPTHQSLPLLSRASFPSQY